MVVALTSFGLNRAQFFAKTENGVLTGSEAFDKVRQRLPEYPKQLAIIFVWRVGGVIHSGASHARG